MNFNSGSEPAAGADGERPGSLRRPRTRKVSRPRLRPRANPARRRRAEPWIGAAPDREAGASRATTTARIWLRLSAPARARVARRRVGLTPNPTASQVQCAHAPAASPSELLKPSGRACRSVLARRYFRPRRPRPSEL